jgi:hypothetical protein
VSAAADVPATVAADIVKMPARINLRLRPFTISAPFANLLVCMVKVISEFGEC